MGNPSKFGPFSYPTHFLALPAQEGSLLAYTDTLPWGSKAGPSRSTQSSSSLSQFIPSAPTSPAAARVPPELQAAGYRELELVGGLFALP